MIIAKKNCATPSLSPADAERKLIVCYSGGDPGFTYPELSPDRSLPTYASPTSIIKAKPTAAAIDLSGFTIPVSMGPFIIKANQLLGQRLSGERYVSILSLKSDFDAYDICYKASEKNFSNIVLICDGDGALKAAITEMLEDPVKYKVQKLILVGPVTHVDERLRGLELLKLLDLSACPQVTEYSFRI